MLGLGMCREVPLGWGRGLQGPGVETVTLVAGPWLVSHEHW